MLDAVLAGCALLMTSAEAGLWFTWGAGPYLLQTVVSLGLSAALLLRRRFPLGSATATCVLLAAMALNVWTAPVGMGTSPLLLCAPLTVVALTRYGRARWWGLAAALVAVAGIPVSPALRLDRGAEPIAPFEAWDELGWMLAAHVLVVAVGYLWALRQRDITERHEAELTEVRVREASRTELATARERNRIAREVHDVVAHSVALIRVEAATGLAIAESEPEHALRSLSTIKETAGGTMAELRALVGVLRESPSDELSPSATLTSVPGMLDRVRASGPDVVADVPGTAELAELDGRLDPMIRLASVRVLQEALTNAVKYADHDVPVRVALSVTDDELRIVARNRVGSRTPAGGGHGVPGLLERVGSVGGHFTAGREGDDYLLTAILPAGAAEAVAPGGGHE